MATAKLKRINLSKAERFSVFSRDNFTCQYCGQKPPDVKLHVDHILPVSKGGTNDPMNLQTGCEACNLGKSARKLSEFAPTPDADAERAKLIQQQFEYRAYLKEKARADAAVEKLVEELTERWRKAANGQCPPSGTFRIPKDFVFRRWIQFNGAINSSKAMDILELRLKTGTIRSVTSEECNGAQAYFGGILKNLRNGGNR